MIEKIDESMPYKPDKAELCVLAKHWARELWSIQIHEFLTGFSEWRERRNVESRLDRLCQILSQKYIEELLAEAREEERNYLEPELWSIFSSDDKAARRRVVAHTHAFVERARATMVTLVGNAGNMEVGTNLTATVSEAMHMLDAQQAVWQDALRIARRAGWTPAGTKPPPAEAGGSDETWGYWDYSSPMGQEVTAQDACALGDALERGAAEAGEPGRFAQIVELCRTSGGFVIF